MNLPFHHGNQPETVFYSPEGNPAPKKPFPWKSLMLGVVVVFLLVIAGGLGWFIFKNKLGGGVVVESVPVATPVPTQALATLAPAQPTAEPTASVSATPEPSKDPTQTIYTSPSGFTLSHPFNWIEKTQSWTEGAVGKFTMTSDMEVALRFLDPNQTSTQTTNDVAGSHIPPNGISFVIYKPVDNPQNMDVTTWAAKHAYDPGQVMPITISGIQGAYKENHVSGYTQDIYVPNNGKIYWFHIYYYPDGSADYKSQVQQVLQSIMFR